MSNSLPVFIFPFHLSKFERRIYVIWGWGCSSVDELNLACTGPWVQFPALLWSWWNMPVILAKKIRSSKVFLSYTQSEASLGCMRHCLNFFLPT